VTGRASLALAVALAAGCATGLRPPPATVATDLDGDARADRIETIQEGQVTRVVRAPAPGSRPARTVVIAIDAVPYAVFARLQREGLFREFFPAARMIAPFPSLTNVGYTAILKTAPVRGYEDKYYDPVAKRVGGGVFDRLRNRHKAVAPFHEAFDWEPPHLWGVTVYYFPITVSRAELRKIEEVLHSSGDEELVLYFGGTDALGHVRGWEGFEECLRLVDQVVRGFLAAGGADRRVVMFSDHGTTAVSSRRVDLGAALTAGGFRLRSRLDRPGDVVAAAYGLVGAIPLYTRCGEEAAVARAATRAPGVDFAAWREGDGVAAVSGDGRPDPLDRPEDRYPDLRARVEKGLRSYVVHPASVIVSLKDGWHYGSGLFEALADMKGTHGSATEGASVGFVASNVDPLPATLPAGEVYPYLGLTREPEPERPFVDPCVRPLTRNRRRRRAPLSARETRLTRLPVADVEGDARRGQRTSGRVRHRRARFDPAQPAPERPLHAAARPRPVEPGGPPGAPTLAGGGEPGFPRERLVGPQLRDVVVGPPLAPEGGRGVAVAHERGHGQALSKRHAGGVEVAHIPRVGRARSEQGRGPGHRRLVSQADDSFRRGVPQGGALGGDLARVGAEGLGPLGGVEGGREVHHPSEGEDAFLIAQPFAHDRRAPQEALSPEPRQPRRALGVRRESRARRGVGGDSRDGVVARVVLDA
jgi:Type I phosphodiesterase / nucleotide pyrophosphatase